MKRVIVITGTPGTGKTTISKRLAESLKGSELIMANDVVKEKKLFTSYAKDGAMIVKMSKLNEQINKMVKNSKANLVIVDGHLLCDMRINGAVAVVVREHLKTLLKRLKARGYGKKKIEDNIVCEAIDYCGVRAAGNYKMVYEIEGGKAAFRQVEQISKGNKVQVSEIDMLGELNGLVE